MATTVTIQKNPNLPPGMDYGLLRRTAMRYLEELGSEFWTDYNIHDPGITIMEALCFAITDLTYRSSFPIEDLLAEQPNKKPQHQRQAFFTARNILTTSPLTPQDYRKLLVDIEGIKNGWIFCKTCACADLYLYANCKESLLQYMETEHKVTIRGLYDIRVEFEDVMGNGDLNSGRLKYNFSFPFGGGLTTKFARATVELRLPNWQMLEENLGKYKKFKQAGSKVAKITILFISGNKEHNQNILQADLGSALRKPLYATLEVSYYPNIEDKTIKESIRLYDVPLLVWFQSDEERKAMQLGHLAAALEDSTNGGLLPMYQSRVQEAEDIIAATRQHLHECRNLCEDYCTITAVAVQDVAICADMDVSPDADIEEILGEAYYRIAEYMSPDIKFYSLKELTEAGKASEDIFSGPSLQNGFIDNQQLDKTQLKTELYASDVINLMMDIPGVVAIRNFVFSPFDKDGKRQAPKSWVYKVPHLHQPRLYMEASKVLVFKNGLPFLPDQLELSDTLQIVRAKNAQPQYKLSELDNPVPEGTYQNWEAYKPLQHELPQTYGVSIYGLPLHASQERRAKAKQLKAYLLFFEQMLANYMAMVANTKSFFDLSESVNNTYFFWQLGNKDIKDLSEISDLEKGQNGAAQSLQQLTETPTGFAERRNLFLDHLLARFAENFTDYTLMLYAYNGNKQRTRDVLIKDKIAFLKAYPETSKNRSKSFNYKKEAEACETNNITGLQKRIASILGFSENDKYWEVVKDDDTDFNSMTFWSWQLLDNEGEVIFKSIISSTADTGEEAKNELKPTIENALLWMAKEEHLQIIEQEEGWQLQILNEDNEEVAVAIRAFGDEAATQVYKEEILALGIQIAFGEKIMLIEHLLLRPHNLPLPPFPNGDPLLPICIGPACIYLCHQEDPYSFRMTIVLNGEGGLANAGIAFRKFADDSIRKVVPSHLSLKICWIATAQLAELEVKWCAYLGSLANQQENPANTHELLKDFLTLFNNLKSDYPPATLHDCQDGNDENRVFLNRTIV